MSKVDELSVLSDELRELLRSEQAAPPAPASARQRVMARIDASLISAVAAWGAENLGGAPHGAGSGAADGGALTSLPGGQDVGLGGGLEGVGESLGQLPSFVDASAAAQGLGGGASLQPLVDAAGQLLAGGGAATVVTGGAAATLSTGAAASAVTGGAAATLTTGAAASAVTGSAAATLTGSAAASAVTGGAAATLTTGAAASAVTGGAATTLTTGAAASAVTGGLATAGVGASGVAATAAAASATTLGLAAASAAPVATGLAAVAGKLVLGVGLASFVAGGAVGVGVHQQVVERKAEAERSIVAARPPPPVAPVEPILTPLPTTVLVAEPEPDAEAMKPAPTSYRAAPKVPAAPEPPVTDRALAQERALVERARSALARHQPTEALSALQDHRGRFSDGRLSEEREALTVQALVSSGEVDAARQSAEEFRKRYPKSLLLPVIESALAGVE